MLWRSSLDRRAAYRIRTICSRPLCSHFSQQAAAAEEPTEQQQRQQRPKMFDEYGLRRPETFTPFMRSQHHALYHCTPEESYKWEQGEAGGAAKEWWAEVEAVKRLLPKRVKLRYGLAPENLPVRLRAAGSSPLLMDRATLDFCAQGPHSRCWSWARCRRFSNDSLPFFD